MTMAPYTFEEITESLATPQNGTLTIEECSTRALAASAGAFCVGFSGGIATQVHFSRYLPRFVRGLLLIPLAVGSLTAIYVHSRSLSACMEQWSSSHNKSQSTSGQS